MADSKPTLAEYLKALAPDFAIADMVEQYGAQHNNKNGEFNDVFFYYSNISSSDKIKIPFYRALIKYETDNGTEITNLPKNSAIYDLNGCKYAIFVNDVSTVKLSGVTFACGVGF